MITRNDIYNELENKLLLQFPNLEVSSVYTDTPSQFPYVYVETKNISRPQKNITLTFDDVQREYEFEVQVFSNKSGDALNEAYSIMEATEGIFNNVYFIETMMSELPNKDTTIRRLVARFRRLVGGGETL